MFILCSISILTTNKKRYADIVKGDFSKVVDLSEEEKTYMATVYQRHTERADIEWVYYDFNKDGVDELILRENNNKNDFFKGIIAIFVKMDNGYKRVLWDTGDALEYFVLNDGNFIYCWEYHGVYQYNCYIEYSFDQEWEKHKKVMLEIYEIDEEEWKEVYGDNKFFEEEKVNEEGRYYQKTVFIEGAEEVKSLSEEEWNEIFEYMTGVEFYTVAPGWY